MNVHSSIEAKQWKPPRSPTNNGEIDKTLSLDITDYY